MQVYVVVGLEPWTSPAMFDLGRSRTTRNVGVEPEKSRDLHNNAVTGEGSTAGQGKWE